MQNEREIHRSLLASDAARGQPAPDPSALQETSGPEPVGGDEKANEEVEEDLGDNVELF